MNIVVIIICISSVTSRRLDLRVIGGRDAVEGEFPYAASLEIVFSVQGKTLFVPVCTGAILSKTWTLTAAHCKQQSQHTKYVIRTGFRSGTDFQNQWQLQGHQNKLKLANVTKTTGDAFDVESIFTHRKHSAGLRTALIAKNDIALVKSKEICLETYAQISAVDHKSLIGLKATVIGYGSQKMEDYHKKININDFKPKTLQVMDVVISKCQELEVSRNLSPVLCISMKCDKMSAAICPGDSGGPLVVDSRVVAVSSATEYIKCLKNIDSKDHSKTRVVPLMTPVSPYISWIANTMNDN